MDGRDVREINVGASTSGLQQSEVCYVEKIFCQKKNFAFIGFCEGFVTTQLIFSLQVDETSATGLDRRSDDPQPSTLDIHRQSLVS